MREWMDEPKDPRPVIGYCAECGCKIHGSCDGYFADKYYDFLDYTGDLVCENDLTGYCDKNFSKGD